MPVNESVPLATQLGKYHNKNVIVGKTAFKPKNLHHHLGATAATRSTILVEISVKDAHYEPGDHVGIFPANRKESVDGILQRLTGIENVDEVLQLQLLKEHHSTNGTFNTVDCANFTLCLYFIKHKIYISFNQCALTTLNLGMC